jgi:pyruvate dehydrogenase E1 component alpha subunit
MAKAQAQRKAVTKPKAQTHSAAPAPARRGANGVAAVKAPAVLTAEEELKAFEQMLLIRRFEERAGQMYGMGLIGGFCHL